MASSPPSMILRGLKQRWGLALALIGLLLAGYGWATYFPPNLAPHLPANWTPGADRWDAAWVPIPEGEPPWLTGYGWHCRGGKWDWFDYRINPSTRRIGSVRLASWNGVGPPRYSCEFADGPSNEIVKVPLIDPAGWLVLDLRQGGPDLQLHRLTAADLQVALSARWSPERKAGTRALQLQLALAHQLQDGRVACLLRTSPTRNRFRVTYWLLHIDPTTLRVAEPMRLPIKWIPYFAEPVLHGETAVFQDRDVCKRLDLATGGFEVLGREPERISPSDTPLRPLRTGWTVRSQYRGMAYPPLLITVQKSAPPGVHDQGSGSLTSELREAVHLLVWRASGRFLNEERFHAIGVAEPGQKTTLLDGDLIAAAAQSSYEDSLGFHPLPGLGMLVTQFVARPPNRLESPRGLLRIGLIMPGAGAVDWLGWAPLPDSVGPSKVVCYEKAVIPADGRLQVTALFGSGDGHRATLHGYHLLDVPLSPALTTAPLID